MKIKLELFKILDEELYEGEGYGEIRLLEGNEVIKEYAKENNIKLYLLVDGYYEFEESEEYKVVQAVDYNADYNIGYDSSHIILLNKKTFETKDYYLHLADGEDY